MLRKPNQDHVFYRTLRKIYPTVSHGEGIYLYDTDGKRHVDGSGGAAVVSIGHGVREITEAMVKQAEKVSFAHSTPLVRIPSPVPSTWRCYVIERRTSSFPGLPKVAHTSSIGCKSSGSGRSWVMSGEKTLLREWNM